MPKKTFDTNVAMNWISTDIQQSEQIKEIKEESKKTVTKKEPVAPKEPKKTKTETQAFTIVGKELKKRQTSLLLKESTYTKLEALSKKNGISVNSCINQILEQVLN